MKINKTETEFRNHMAAFLSSQAPMENRLTHAIIAMDLEFKAEKPELGEVPGHEIKISASPKLLGYIDALIESEHGYGSTRDEVALYLIWQEVNRLRESGRELARAAGRQEGP